MHARKLWIAPLLAGVALLLASCADNQSENQSAATPSAPAAAATAAASPTASATPKPDYVGKLQLTPASGKIGSTVKAAGTGFAANSDLTLVWQDINGKWTVKEDGSFMGRSFEETQLPLATVKTNASGAFDASFTVPDGFGYVHNVYVMQDKVIRNQAGYSVKMEVEISPKSGPVGTPIHIKVKGIGYQYLENSWQLNYDNKYNGWLSSVTTHGNANAIITAVGAPGPHILQVLHGWSFVPYLNNAQSPRPDRETFTLQFEITPGAAVAPPPLDQQQLPIVKREAPKDNGQPAIWTDLESGPIETKLTLKGVHLPAGPVELRWYRVTGNRVGGGGWSENDTVLGTVQAGSDGAISLVFNALDDLGGPHRIEAIVGGKAVATTSYTITPSALPIDHPSGPAGTVATIHLKGVGWTETANIYTVVYDGAYMGFACGFNSQGDIQVLLPLTGTPGPHFVDLYPAIYKGTDVKGTDNYREPQLTYAQDHPGEKLPAFRFMVNVTGPAQAALP